MVFRIADTFTNSLATLSGEEQKLVKTTAFDLQMNPANPGHQFHKLDKAKDKNFWSVRVSLDIRIIVHKNENNLLLCYVDHHDKAYHWAERRKIEIHPKTGAAQLVEIRESVREITIPHYVHEEKVKKPLMGTGREDLLKYGIPEEWIEDLIDASEERLLEIAEHLPGEASEAVLNLAIGVQPKNDLEPVYSVDPFDHPDALRRFRVMDNQDELERALEAPWEQWSVFLHPDQKSIVEGSYSGPVRVSGSAGTGKTIVALHRAVYLAKSNPDSHILLTTFSSSLADALEEKLKVLLYKQPRLGEQIEVFALDSYVTRLHRRLFGPSEILRNEEGNLHIKQVLDNRLDISFSLAFLCEEWADVVDQRQILSWDDYKDARRLGRRKRLSEEQRKLIWDVFDEVNSKIEGDGKKTLSRIYKELENHYEKSGKSPFDYVIVDEAQDISIPALQFLSSLSDPQSQKLFFSGDLGQRIFQQPFSWSSLGVDIRGRSKILKVNYRTSHQIRTKADMLLDTQIKDSDGIAEQRNETISVFNGTIPDIYIAENKDQEISHVSEWINHLIDKGVTPEEIGVIVRSENQIDRAISCLEKSEQNYCRLKNGRTQNDRPSIILTTMHYAKGLEFKAVIVMACDDDVIPSSDRMDNASSESAMEEVYITERHLLYVACTRARDYLLISGISPGSEFLDDMEVS